MQGLVLPERVSSGMSVTDPNQSRQKSMTEKLIERQAANRIGTFDRRPTIFAPGTPMQSLYLVDRSEQLPGLYGMPRREFGGAISDSHFVPQPIPPINQNLREKRGVHTELRFHERDVVEGSEVAEPHLQGQGASMLEHRSAGATDSVAESDTQTQTATAPIEPPEFNIIAATPLVAEYSIPPLPARHPPPPPVDAARHCESVLARRLVSEQSPNLGVTIVEMDRLQVRSPELSTVKAKAIEDARQMQARVIEECKKTGKDPPPYGLVELIGKGSFGRVYMG